MLEIKSYDDWIEDQQELGEPTQNLKKYTDYVRAGYYKAGQLTEDNEKEIVSGVADRLKSDGLVTDDMPDEDKEAVFSSIIGSGKNSDADARFVLDHIRTKSEEGVDPNDVKASTLYRYLSLKERSPSEAEGLKPYVDEIIADKSLVKRARMSAADRGEYSVVALDEEDGSRTLYAGPTAKPESIPNEVSSLLATGALSSSDLYRVNNLTKPLNGGLTNVAEDSRNEEFRRAVSELAKKDKDFNKLIQDGADAVREEKTAALRTTGETIWEGTKTVAAYPFVKAADFVAETFFGDDEEPPKYAPDTKLSDVIASNPAFSKRFSAAEIEKFSAALTDTVAGAPYRADRPETGIATDSMGNTIIAPQIVANPEKFAEALERAPLNSEQKKRAVAEREVLSKQYAPDLLKLILEEDPDAAGPYAKAKADGLSMSQFVEQYLSDPKNYDGFSARLETLGKSAWKTLAEIPLGIAALAGNEWAAKEMGEMIDSQSRAQEFSRLFGDEFGLGFQIVNTLPQVATDIGLTIGTAGAFAGAKALAKTGAMSARSILRAGAKMALSEVDDVAATAFRQASEVGGEQYLGKTFKEVGRSVSSKFGELAPLAAVTFTRSAGSAFGSIYNQLPDDMSHEEKYKAALTPALAMGLSTAVITVGMSAINRDGVETISTKKIRAMRGGETDEAVVAGAIEAGERVVPVGKMNYRQSKAVFEDVFNEGRIMNDTAFGAAARSAIAGTYKNWLRTTLKGGLDESFEEALDQAVGIAIEDAALDQETPLSEKVAQVFNAGLIGGAFGVGAAGATQFGPIKKSEQSLVFEGRASALEDIASRLRKVDSTMTADVLQRRIDEARTQANMSVENDIAIQDALGKFQERVENANLGEKNIQLEKEQEQFGVALKQPFWDYTNKRWTTLEQRQDEEKQAEADTKIDKTLLADIIGERVSYGDFDGVLELGPDKSVHLRLDKPYGKKGGQMIEFINLGPRFQKASNLVSQEPTFLTTGEPIFDVPAGTPYVTQGKYKEKFAFPSKDKVTPESFDILRDDEGNVRSVKIDGGQSLKNASVRMPIIITGDSQIQAVAKWYGLDVEPKPVYEESPEGQLQFGFVEGEIQDDENLRILTPEELNKQTEQTLQQLFPTQVGEEQLGLELGLDDAEIKSVVQENAQNIQRTRIEQVLNRFDQDILTKQERLESTGSDAAKEKLRKEIRDLKKAKKNYSEETIQLGTTTPTPDVAGATPRKYRSWGEMQQQMDRDWVSSLDQIKTNYSTTVDGPLDVAQLEDAIFATPLRTKLGVRLSFKDVTDSQLDAIEQMANDVISYANDPENKASESTREATRSRYADLIGRVQVIQQYRAELSAPSESEYKKIYEELRDAGFEVTVTASDLDTLHYLLSTKPQEISPTKVTKSVASIDEKTGQPTARRTEERDVGTVTIFPFANPTFIQQAKAQGVEINEERLTETQVVQIEGYDQDTREILYKGEGGITMRAPLSIVDLSPPTLRELIDAESKGVFDATQQAKRDAAAFKRRTPKPKPIQDRAIEFLTSVSNYVKKITELDARLEEATGRRPSSFVKKLKNQISEVKKQASAFINQKGGLLVEDIQFYQSLDDNGRQEIIDSVRAAIYGQGGYKSVAPRAKVYVLRPEAKIPTTKVELPKGEFRKGTQEEQLVQELIEGGFKVDLQGLGQRLALSHMFETESGMMKYPAFSGSTVEYVQQEGQEVAETNSYIKNSNEFLGEEILKRYPQLGEFGYSSKAAKIKGKISSVGDGDAMLASIQVELTNLDSRIATAEMTGAPVPDSILEKRAVLAEQLKKYKTLLSEERYYKIGKKEYETRLSQQYTGIHYPVEEEIVQGETITFGVFTNNYEITRAQIAAGLRIRIPDSFDRDLFNPAQHKSKDGNMIDGYYLPYEQEPYMVGTTYRTSNPNIDENGEQVLDLRVTQNVLRKRLLVDRMVNPELMKVRIKDASGEERFRSSRFREFYVAAMDSIVKRSRIFLEGMARNQNPRYPWTYIGMDNTISELSIGYTADLNEYRLAQHIVKKAIGSLKWKNLTNESMGRETLARFLEEEGGMKFEYEQVQDPNYVADEGRAKAGARRRVVSSVTPSIEFGDLPDSIRRQIITEEGNITDKIKATNLSKFVVEMMDGDVDSIANDIKAVYKDIRGTDPHSVISEYARRLFVNATVVGGKFYSLPNYAGSDMIKKLKTVANKYAKAEQDAISRISLDALPDLDGFDVESIVGAAGNDLFQAVLDHITSTRQKLGAAGVPDLFESAGELTGALTSSELAFVDRGAFLADELYNTVQSDKAVGQAFRDIAEWVGLKKNELDNLPDTAVVSALAGKLNTDYVFHTNKGAARIALFELSKTEAGKRAAGLLIMRGWLPPVMVDGREVPLQAPLEREVATPAATFDRRPRRGESPADKAARELLEAEQAIEAGRKLRKEQVSTKEIIDYSRQYLDAVQSLLPSINEASRIKSLELRGIEEARADIYDSYRLIRALVGATTPEEGGMVHTKTQKEIAEGIELGAPFVTSGEVNKFLSREVAAIQSELTTLRDKRNKVEQLFEQDAPRMLERLNLILNGSPDFTRDENGKPVPVKGGGKPPLLETVKDKKKRRALLAEVRQLQEKSTAILTFGRETMDSLDASISVKEGQLQKAEARKNIATPVLLDSLFANIARANQQIDMQRGFISRLSTTVRDRIKEEQASVERLRNLEPYKRYVELVTGLPVVAERSAERSEAMERLLDLAERSAADRKRIQDYADKRREELAKALVNSGVGLHNSGLLSTYVDPVDVAPTPAPASAPVEFKFSEGAFSQAERRRSTADAFVAESAEFLTRDERETRDRERAREELAGIDIPTRGGKVLGKVRAYDPNRLRAGDTPPELPEMEQFEGVDVPTREVGGRLKPLSKPRAYDPNDQFQSLSTLDPALRDEARAENIAEVQRLGLESGNPNSVVEALKVIAKTGSPRQRLIAQLLSTAPDFIRNIRFAIVELDLGFAGLFDRDSNTVVVNLNEHNGRGLVDVLLHEYLHAPTVNVLLDPKTTAQRKAVARIEAIRNFAAANAARLGIDTEPAVRLGLQSNVEFLTYAFTAPDFQNILAGLTLPQQRSILRRIVDAVLSVFGLDPKKHMVAADAIQELFDFTKMSLAHSGTFSLDGKMRALSRSSRRDNERALAYSNLRSAELINDIVARYQEGEEGSVFLTVNPETDARYLELAKNPEANRDELQRMVDRAAKAAGYNRKGVRFGFYVNGVPMPPSIADQNFGPGYYIAEDADPTTTSDSVSVSPIPNNKSLEIAGLSKADVEFRRDVVYVKAQRPLQGNLPEADRPLLDATIAYESAVNDAYSKVSRYGYLDIADIAKARGASQLESSISSLAEDHQKYNRGIALLIKQGKIDYDSLRGIGGREGMSSELVVQNASQIKLADPVSYDSDGNVIPLSQRFQLTTDDIRYIQAVAGNAAPLINVLEEIKRILPEGVALVENEQLAGNMGARRSVPNTIFVNPNRVNDMVGGLSRANAKSVVRTAVDEELAHLASYAVFTEEDFVQVADELSDEILNRTAHRMFETILPDYVERQDYITSELASGNLRRSDIAAEWVRSQITRMATGRTREADLAFLYTNPSLLERILVGLKEFIFKLKQLFKAEPTVGTAARISQASRAFRKLQNGGVLPIPEPSAANEYGDTTAFLNALAGDIVEGQEDRTHYMIAVAGTGASKTKIKGIWEKIQDKMYNLPSELRKLTNERSGYMSRTGYNIEDFDKQWPKMREAAIAAGFTVEELGMILGTTEPLVQGDARKEIQRKVRKFKEDNATDPDIEAKADAYEEQLWQPEADKFYAKFRKEQKAMEDKLRARGLGKQVDYLIEFRKQINKDSHAINLDANNDIYLTRSYRFLTTEGWAKAAKEGGVYEIDGKFVDFDKLRVAALKHFEYDVDFEAKQNGVTLTDAQRNIKLVEKLDAYLEDLVKRSEDAQKLGPLKGLKKDLNRLLRKKDFDAPLRELLGEVTDPFENAVRTAFNVGRFAANERFLKGFAETAIESGLASRDRKPNMVMLFETNEVSAGELAGLYINKDIAAAVREEIGVNGMNMQSRSMEQINNIGRVLSKFSGLTVAAKTMGSVGYYPRNILGGMALTTAQGIINPVNFKQALRVSFSANMQWSKIKAGSVEEREEIRRLTELQVLKDDTQGRIAMDMLRGFSNSVDEQFEDLIDDIVEAQSTGNIGKIVKRFKQLKSEGSYVKGVFAAAEQGINPTLEFLAGLNNIIDSAFKVNAYYYELGVLQKAYGNSESNSKLEAESARKVKMTFPTHSDQIDFVKSFNRSPFAMLFMPFLRWKTEVIRTMINTPKLAMEEIKSGNAVLRNRGIQRLVGFTSTLSFGASVYGMIFSALFGMLTDDEDEEREGVRKLTDEELSALKEGLPEWQRVHGIFAQQLKDGSVQVIDMSNIMPYSQVTDLSGLIMRGDIKGVAKYFSKEILGTQIAATATVELMNNRDSFNQPIWLETDSALQASIKMWKHLGSATLLPAIVLKGQQAFRAGEQNTKEILVGELTGARPIIHKLPDIEYRGLRRFKDTADSVVSMLYPLSSGKMIELDKVETIIDDHQAAANKNQERMHNFFNGMKSLGSTEASLAATAKQMKFSKQRFAEAITGTNFPWVANKQLFQKIYENKTRVGEQDPVEVINKINEVILKNKADQYKVNFYR